MGQLRFTFDAAFVSEPEPWLLLQASRPYEFHGWTPGNLSYPTGAVTIDDDRREIYGFNRERQDNILGPDRAPKFSGYFVARFDVPWTSAGLARNCNTSQLFEGETSRTDEPCLSGYVRFSKTTKVVNVRIGVSFISIDQARANLDDEIPDGRTLEETAHRARKAWAENLDRIKVQGGTKEQRITLYTAAFHALQARHCHYSGDPRLTCNNSTRTRSTKAGGTTLRGLTRSMKASHTTVSQSGTPIGQHGHGRF